MVAWLEAQDTDRRMLASVSSERRLILLPDKEGGRLNRADAHEGRGFVYRYVSCTCPESLILDVAIPPFELTQVHFDVEEGCLSVELPPDHMLPWPKLKLDCSSYEAEQMVVEALEWRLYSLIAAGQTTFSGDMRMPDRLRRLLPPGKWAECVRTAKTLSGVS